jgi:hypothetical protein
VLDAAGIPVTTVSDVRVTAAAHPCDSAGAQNRIAEPVSGTPGLHNLGDGYYQFNRQTHGGFASSCRTMRLDLGDDLLRTVEFRFTA